MRARHLRALALVASVALAPAGPALAQQPDSQPTAGRTPSSAFIQPGDKVVLKVWREAALSDTMAVDESGMVVLPRLGPFSLARQTIASLQDSLRHLYSEYLRNPSIEITVLRRVGVHGEVKSPGLYWVDVTVTLRDVLAIAGGLTEIADIHKVQLVRGRTARKVPDWENTTALASDLMSGDQIVVGRTSWLSRNTLSVVSAAGVLTSIVVIIFRL